MPKQNASILIVDDDQAVRTAAQLFLKQLFSLVITAGNPEQITELMKDVHFDVILLDMNFSPGRNDGAEGMKWLGKILKTDPSAVVVFITAFGGVDLAVSAMRSGAFDFIVKPWKNDKLLGVIRTALKMRESNRMTEKYRQRQDLLLADMDQQSGMILGQSLAMKKVQQTIEKVARTDADVLLLGENGTGKEVVAREIHRCSYRKQEPFIGVDLGAIHSHLFESELFGHARGSFTDARQDKAGRFEVASGGTLFLDEIGNLSLPLQVKLLSVLESRELIRLGTNRPVPIDVRLICATNMPLYEMTRKKEFREDLLYRINTVEIRIPPLRERTGDLPMLIKYFLDYYANKYNKKNLRIPKSIFSRLESYPWPGNIRELRHAIERAVILSEGDLLEFGDLLTNLSLRQEFQEKDTLNLKEMERRYILKAISKNRGNITKAAEDLGLARAALYRRLEKHGL
jgi:DNA-binding NtrC family response regulator